MSLSASRDSGAGRVLQCLLHAAELLVEHLALQHVLAARSNVCRASSERQS